MKIMFSYTVGLLCSVLLIASAKRSRESAPSKGSSKEFKSSENSNIPNKGSVGSSKETAGSRPGPPPPPMPRPELSNLDFVLRCPPEEAFRLIPYILIEKQNGSQAQPNIQATSVRGSSGTLWSRGSKGEKFPSSKERELHSTYNSCIEWKKGKKPTGSNQKDKLIEAFWSWLGLANCTTSSSSTDTTGTTDTDSSSVIAYDLPMMDDPGLSTSCPMKTQITNKCTSFNNKSELEKYWRSLFSTSTTHVG